MATFLTQIWGMLQRRVEFQEHGEQLKPEIRCFFQVNEAGSGFKILPNMRTNNDANVGVLLSLHTIKVAFFFPQGDFYNQKKQQLNQQHQNIHFIIWFLLEQCSSTLASWASRKLMSLMKRQSKDLRLFLKSVFGFVLGLFASKVIESELQFCVFPRGSILFLGWSWTPYIHDQLHVWSQNFQLYSW